MTTAALIVAAGRGTRLGGAIPKQYQILAGRPVIAWTLEALAAHPAVGLLVAVIHPDDRELFARCTTGAHGTPLITAEGGADRAGSVRAGLAALPETVERVLIHDCARPLLSAQLVDAVLAGLDEAPGAAPALAVTDALWRGADGIVTGTQDRNGLYRAQTPQGFRRAEICAAHAAHPGGAADDVEVARAAGLDVRIVRGEEENIKITLPGDIARADAILRRRGADGMDFRVGNGFDVHRFCAGDAVVLCGVRVPHDRALEGHSDADVGMHAVTDALYGALAEGDIGRHFPPSDPQWKGVDSAVFLRHAGARVAERGFRIANIDCTLICERPKIGPHAATMGARLAEILGIPADRVSVKATTSERLGFTGRGEGIAAMASVGLVGACG